MQTPPSDRPITVEEAAAHLREFDQHYYGTISRMIDAAVESLQNQYWTQFCTATFDEHFDGWPAGVFRLARNPLGTVSSIKYTDAAAKKAAARTRAYQAKLREHIDANNLKRLRYREQITRAI